MIDNNTQIQIAAADPDYYYNRMADAGLVYENTLSEATIPEEIINRVPKDIAISYEVVPVEYSNNVLTLITCSSSTLKQPSVLSDKLQCQVKLLITTEFNLRQGILKFYNVEDLSHRNFTANQGSSISSPLKLKAEKILHDAAAAKASDIHILPTGSGMTVMYRINGHLIDVTNDYQIKKDDISTFTNLIWSFDHKLQYKKNMANDGSFNIISNGITYSIRISTTPIATINPDDNWHKIVLRLLPQDRTTQTLEELKYPQDVLVAIRRTLLQNANGMVLMAGETGSGKTTTLYAMIDEQIALKGEMQNVCTIENPVEIHDSRYTQCQVRNAADDSIAMTPNKILQSLLRQDPDIILYGEIRSRDDAEKTIEAATTGHKVFSTVHASNCVSTIVRLLDLGVPRTSLLGQLNMIVSQRLLSPLCPHCSRPHTLTDIEKSVLSQKEIDILTKGTESISANLREKGSPIDIAKCKNPECNMGYLKRKVIPEYIEFDDELRDDLMSSSGSFTATQKILQKRGFKSMWNRVFPFILSGRIELKEALMKIGRAQGRGD